MHHPEVEQLKNQFEKHNIKISEPLKELKEGVFFVKLSIGNKSWDILIDDEYRDFSKEHPLVNWFLVLYALETYEECADILEWSNFYGIESTLLLAYYKSLATTYREIEAILGRIDPLISTYDYTLRTGKVSALKNINLK